MEYEFDFEKSVEITTAILEMEARSCSVADHSLSSWYCCGIVFGWPRILFFSSKTVLASQYLLHPNWSGGHVCGCVPLCRSFHRIVSPPAYALLSFFLKFDQFHPRRSVYNLCKVCGILHLSSSQQVSCFSAWWAFAGWCGLVWRPVWPVHCWSWWICSRSTFSEKPLM